MPCPCPLVVPLQGLPAGRINGARRRPHAPPDGRAPERRNESLALPFLPTFLPTFLPADAGRNYAPSTPVTGWMSACSSSACSPVTRYTTRLATETAWSAKRS